MKRMGAILEVNIVRIKKRMYIFKNVSLTEMLDVYIFKPSALE